MKTRVLVRNEPIEEKSWAWCLALREDESRCRVYEINPFAEVCSLHENVYSIYMESTDGFGDVWSHLIIGPEKAMLIDTGFGIGDLKGLAEQLAGGKPLLVVSTHSYPDHAYGNCQFDKIYCHKYSVPSLEQQKKDPHIWDHLFDANGKGIWFDCTPADVIPYRDYEIVGCENHTIFNLGGDHDVELVFLPGHSAGSCFFLDKKLRILFCGDAMLSMRVGVFGPREGEVYPEYTTLRSFRDELVYLAARAGEFDGLYPGHFILGLDPSVVQNMLDTCNEIIADPDCYDEIATNPFVGERRLKAVKGMGSLAYSVNSVG